MVGSRKAQRDCNEATDEAILKNDHEHEAHHEVVQAATKESSTSEFTLRDQCATEEDNPELEDQYEALAKLSIEPPRPPRDTSICAAERASRLLSLLSLSLPSVKGDSATEEDNPELENQYEALSNLNIEPQLLPGVASIRVTERIGRFLSWLRFNLPSVRFNRKLLLIFAIVALNGWALEMFDIHRPRLMRRYYGTELEGVVLTARVRVYTAWVFMVGALAMGVLLDTAGARFAYILCHVATAIWQGVYTTGASVSVLQLNQGLRFFHHSGVITQALLSQELLDGDRAIYFAMTMAISKTFMDFGYRGVNRLPPWCRLNNPMGKTRLGVVLSLSCACLALALPDAAPENAMQPTVKDEAPKDKHRSSNNARDVRQRSGEKAQVVCSPSSVRSLSCARLLAGASTEVKDSQHIEAQRDQPNSKDTSREVDRKGTTVASFQPSVRGASSVLPSPGVTPWNLRRIGIAKMMSVLSRPMVPSIMVLHFIFSMDFPLWKRGRPHYYEERWGVDRIEWIRFVAKLAYVCGIIVNVVLSSVIFRVFRHSVSPIYALQVALNAKICRWVLFLLEDVSHAYMCRFAFGSTCPKTVEEVLIIVFDSTDGLVTSASWTLFKVLTASAVPDHERGTIFAFAMALEMIVAQAVDGFVGDALYNTGGVYLVAAACAACMCVMSLILHCHVRPRFAKRDGFFAGQCIAKDW